MITLQALPTFNLVGNQVNVVATTDNLYPAAEKAGLVLQIDALNSTPGQKLSLAWNGKTLKFNSANEPNDSGLELPVAGSGSSIESWCRALAEHFSNNYELSSDFHITAYQAGSFWTIGFEAREYGSAYNLVYDPQDFDGFISVYGFVTAVDRSRREGFKILLQVVKHDDESILGEDLATPDDSGKAVFDISDYLKSTLRPNLVWPEPSGEKFQIQTEAVKRFFLKYGEYFDGAFRVLKKTTVATFGLLGGLSYEYEGLLQELGLGYFDYNNNNRCFLTWGPKEKLVSPDQPEKLSFLLAGDCMIIIDIWFEDSTTAHEEIACENPGNAILEIFAGTQQLGFATAYPGKVVSNYRIILRQDDEIISETRSFVIDKQYYEFERVFVFRNSFARYDFVRFTGKGSEAFEYDRETAFTYPSFPRKLSTPSLIDTESKQTQLKTANSGWMDAGMKKLVSDFLMSRERYELIDGRIYPVSVKTKKFAYSDDNENLFSLDVEYMRASFSINFSSLEFGSNNPNNYLYILDSGFWAGDLVWGAAMVWNA